jgi:signal transduction histidine kinase
VSSKCPPPRRRVDIGAKGRIAVAAAAVGLLLCGAFGFAADKHGESVRASARAARDRNDAMAAERAVTTFWHERETLGEVIAFPHLNFKDELRDTQFSFHQALRDIGTQSSAELNSRERAKNANENLLALFDEPPGRSLSVSEESRKADQLSIAELAVIGPLEKLRTSNRRENLRARRIAGNAERATFRTEVATAGFGLLAVALFALFAMRQVRRIDDQNIELQASDAAKDEFVSTVSHELRTPMTSINGYVELLLDEGEGVDPLTEEQRSFLTTVQRGSSRLESLINDLLFTAQARSGQLMIRRKPTDVVELARDAVDSAQTNADHKGLHLSLTTPAEPIVVEADAGRVGQAIDNLISNAIKFTPENGNVDVTLAQGAGRMTLTVADTGMGMTSSDIDHLFDRFFRTDSAQAEQIQGTGLGLPIVQAIVEAHDGTISVTSEPHVGSSFVVSMPLAHPVAA